MQEAALNTHLFNFQSRLLTTLKSSSPVLSVHIFVNSFITIFHSLSSYPGDFVTISKFCGVYSLSLGQSLSTIEVQLELEIGIHRTISAT